ncbi:oligosaccharide flippase family protein [Flavobacterium pedocola]
MVYGIGQVINIISPLLITPYLIYVCGLEKLGIIAIGQSFAYILIVIVDYSSYIIGVKEISVNRDEKTILESLFKTIYAAKGALFFVVALLSLLLIYAVPYFREEKTVFFFSFTIIIAQFLNPTWFLQGVENFKWITVINVISKIIYVMGVLSLVKTQSDYIFANLWMGLGSIVANIIGLLWIFRTYRFSLKIVPFALVKELLVRDFSFCVSQLFLATRNYSAVVIIGFFSGDYVAGQFKVVEQIINLFRTYLQLFFKFSYSYVCFAIDDNFKKGVRLWQKFNGFNFIFLVLLLVLVVLFSTEILTFFKVDAVHMAEIENYLHLAVFIPFLIGITLPLEQLIFSLNKNKEYIRVTILSTIFNILGLSVLMHTFGLAQAFFLLIFTEACLAGIYCYVLKNEFNKLKHFVG